MTLMKTFEIDPRTGQLKVNNVLNYDTVGVDPPPRAYDITVNVADSSGTTSLPDDPMGTDTVMVTITVTNVDEKPEFSTDTGESTIEVMENETNLGEDPVDTYMATDPEGAVVTFTLSGDDGGKFELGDPVIADSMVLAFKDKPDFEDPGDMNGDNVYEVTVVASDGATPAMRDVTVKVTNMPEPGKLGVMPAQPRIAMELTAELTDSDGVVSGPTWQWYKQKTANLPDAIRDGDGDGDVIEAWEKIKDATSDSYTPVSEDNEAWLLVTVDYIDGYYDYDADATEMGFARTVDLVLSGMVQGSSANMAPEFDEGTTAMRYVPENSPEDTNVGARVVAKDIPPPTYELGGRDAGSFKIGLTDGQIMVKADAELDHETKPIHTVTVTATDSQNDTATITVTIHVTDMDEAPEAMKYVHSIVHDENDTDAVITLTATDPEDVPTILWSLLENADDGQDIPGEGDNDGEDDADDVAVGDFEDYGEFKISADGVLEFKESPDFEMPRGVIATNTNTNTYKVVVQASDGATMAPLSWFKVTVEVDDQEEEGSIKLRPTTREGTTLLQPQVGVSITAHDLMDSDEIVESNAAPTYKWYRTSSRTAMGTEIDEAIEAVYVPMGGGDSDVDMYVRVVATYTDGGPTSGDKTATAVSEYKTIGQIFNNTVPEFSATSAARAVPEETPKGTAVGTTITATDADSGEILTYWLSEVDAGDFDIDPRTGQIMVGDVTLESDGNSPTTEYSVIVNVADSSAAPSSGTDMGTATIPVTITVVPVDEDPTFSDEDQTGASTIEVQENETDLDEGAMGTYSASDPEEAVVTFTLSGDDDDKFKLTGDTLGTRTLVFKDKPDFENPGDMNGDNVYEVTVVASDGANAAMRDVTVKVTNIGEDGKIEVMPTQPRVGVELTAELTDSDGVVSGPTWQWYKQVAAELPSATRTEGGDLPDAWDKIKDATSDSYTPVSDDNGDWLLVTVDYIDGYYDTAAMTFNRTVDSVLPGMVQGSSVNMEPEFDGRTATRYVPEDAAAEDMVGKPVVAKDPGDTLGYMLSGADAGSFDIDGTGQITVSEDAELDHETKPTHTVIVTATDPHNASATITVTIHVTDVDEAPQIYEGTLKVEGQSSAEYAENRTDAVVTYMVRGTNADSARWSLSGDDMRAFTISGGMLRFRATPRLREPG